MICYSKMILYFMIAYVCVSAYRYDTSYHFTTLWHRIITPRTAPRDETLRIIPQPSRHCRVFFRFCIHFCFIAVFTAAVLTLVSAVHANCWCFVDHSKNGTPLVPRVMGVSRINFEEEIRSHSLFVCLFAFFTFFFFTNKLVSCCSCTWFYRGFYCVSRLCRFCMHVYIQLPLLYIVVLCCCSWCCRGFYGTSRRCIDYPLTQQFFSLLYVSLWANKHATSGKWCGTAGTPI